MYCERVTYLEKRGNKYLLNLKTPFLYSKTVEHTLNPLFKDSLKTPFHILKY